MSDKEESDTETPQINQELLNKIFQQMSHLTQSVILLNDRLDRIDSTTNRIQNRLSNVQNKFMQRVLAIDDAEISNK